MLKDRIIAIAAGVAIAAAVAVALLVPDRGGQKFDFGPCGIRGVSVQCADLESGAVAVVTGTPETSFNQIVVFDPGGPGADLRSSIDVLHSLASESSIAVGFIEPWTTEGVDDVCKAAADGYLATMRRTSAHELPNLILDLERDCPNEVADAQAFTQERADVVRYIVDQSPSAQVKYLGWSFATFRLAAMSIDVPIDGALLISPVVHDQPWRIMMTNRASESRVLLERVDVDVTEPNDARVSMEDRSTDLTPFDVAAGAYASVYDIETNGRWLPAALNAYQRGNVDSDALAQLAYAADTVEGRYGVDSLYVGIIGYWAEFCQSVVDGPATALEPTDDIAWFLFSFHQPCDTVDPQRESAMVNADVSCLVVGGRDPLAVGTGADGWREPPTIVTVQGAGHILSVDQPAVGDLVKDFATTGAYPCET